MTEPQFAELSRAYAVGPWSETSIAADGTNLTYFVTAETGAYVLRQSRRRKIEGSLQAEVAVLRYLSDQGFPAPAPVPTREGGLYATYNDRFFLLSARLAGAPIDRDRPAQLAEAGRGLGALHDLMRRYTGPTHIREAPRIVEMAQRAVHLDEVERQAAPHLDAAAARGFREAVAHVRARLADLGPAAERLPPMMIHGSYRRSSLLFDGDRLSAVLDFDAASLDSRNRDLARALQAFCDGEDAAGLDLERCATFLSAYRAAAPIPDDEPWDAVQALEAYRISRLQRHVERLLARPDDAARVRKLAGKIEAEAETARTLHAAGARIRAAAPE